MTVSETYVDPAIAGNSGTGVIGDPYGDLQFALDTMTRDAVNGDRINIKAGTDEVLVAALSLVAYGTPITTAPIIFQGYTSAADDGGIGGIDADANSAVFDSTTLDSVMFIDMRLHNSGAGDFIVRVDDFCLFENCRFEDGSSVALLSMGLGCKVYNCYFENGSSLGVDGSTIEINNCVFRNGVADFTAAIRVSSGSEVIGNILILSGSSIGIVNLGSVSEIKNNSIFSVSGTGDGIVSAAANRTLIVLNNVIEGFSGIGGIAINSTALILLYGGNQFFDNETDKIGDVVKNLGDNNSLALSAFLDAANDDFRITTAIQALAYPTKNFPDLSVRSYLDIGALQRKSFPLISPGMAGGVRG